MSVKPEVKFGAEYKKLMEHLTKTVGLNQNTAQQHLIDVANGLVEPKYGLGGVLNPKADINVEIPTETPTEAIIPQEVPIHIPRKRGRPPKQV